MNYTSKRKLAIIIFITAFLFFFVGRQTGHGYPVTNTVTKAVAGKTITVTKSVPTTKTVTLTKTVPADTKEWKALKDVDDSGFNTESQVLSQIPDIASTCSDAITAAGNNDQQGLNLAEASIAITTAKIKGLTVDLTNEVNQRQLILKQLGY